MTSETGNMGAILNAVWAHILPALQNETIPADKAISTIPLKLVATPVPGETKTRVAGSGTWTDANTFMMTWRFIETAHYETVTCRFDGDRVSVSFENSIAKINKTADSRPVLMGSLRPKTGVKR